MTTPTSGAIRFGDINTALSPLQGSSSTQLSLGSTVSRNFSKTFSGSIKMSNAYNSYIQGRLSNLTAATGTLPSGGFSGPVRPVNGILTGYKFSGALSGNYIYYSSDGKSWSQSAALPTNYWAPYDVCQPVYFGGKYYFPMQYNPYTPSSHMSGNDNAAVAITTDFSSWTKADIYPEGFPGTDGFPEFYQGCLGSLFTNGSVICGCIDIGENFDGLGQFGAVYSSNGTTWSQVTGLPTSTNFWPYGYMRMFYFNNTFIIIGYLFDNTNYKPKGNWLVWTSTNGSSFSQSLDTGVAADLSGFYQAGYASFSQIGSTLYLAVCSTNNSVKFWSTTNGTSYTSVGTATMPTLSAPTNGAGLAPPIYYSKIFQIPSTGTYVMYYSNYDYSSDWVNTYYCSGAVYSSSLTGTWTTASGSASSTLAMTMELSPQNYLIANYAGYDPVAANYDVVTSSNTSISVDGINWYNLNTNTITGSYYHGSYLSAENLVNPGSNSNSQTINSFNGVIPATIGTSTTRAVGWS